MRRFASLCAALSASSATEARLAALQRYLAGADPVDAAWALQLLVGGKPRRAMPAALLRAEACVAAGIPDWLFEASLQATGDLAETIAQILPPPRAASLLGLSVWLTERLLPLRGEAAARQIEQLHSWWDELQPDERWVLNKLIGGDLRPGVSRLQVQRALARHAGLDPRRVAQRMLDWTDASRAPSAERMLALLAPEVDPPTRAPGQPYPVSQASTLDCGPEASTLEDLLGQVEQWQAEWCCSGLRAQILCESGQVWIWSLEEALITEQYPEVVASVQHLPEGTVLDGELLVWLAGAPAPFNLQQQRASAKTLSRRQLVELPVKFVAHDLLALGAADWRAQPWQQRRLQLEALSRGASWLLAQQVQLVSWDALVGARQRARGGESLMLRRRDASDRRGQGQAGAWVWPCELQRVDCVLVYAQLDQRTGSDYSFAVWSREPASAAEADAVVTAIERREQPMPGALQLLTFAKVGSGLNEEVFKGLDKVIRANTVEKFGPVRSLRPSLVFELGFEAIARSPRHKSGVALKAPRLLRVLPDKPLHEANSIDWLIRLLAEPVAPAHEADPADRASGAALRLPRIP
jgi:DNA ligase-1